MHRRRACRMLCAMAAIDAMTADELAHIVYGHNGYARYILGTREPGRGHDDAYTYDEWCRARLQLSVIGLQVPIAGAAEPAPAAGTPATDGQARAPEPGRSLEPMAWRLDEYLLVRQLWGTPEEVFLSAGFHAPRHHGAGVSSASARRAAGNIDTPGPTSSPASRGGESGFAAPDVALVAPFGGSPAGVDQKPNLTASPSSGGGRAATMFATSVAIVDPALGWLVSQSGVARLVGGLLEQLFDWSSLAPPPLVQIAARAPSNQTLGAIYGACGLERGRLSLRGEPASGDDADGRGQLVLSLKTGADAGVALVFSGVMQARASGALARDLRTTFDRCRAHAIDYWKGLWQDLAHEGQAEALIAHGVHRLLSAEQRAHVVNAIRSGLCGATQQTAILQVLDHSLSAGDAGEVMAHLGGVESALESLSWVMDGDRDQQLRQLSAKLQPVE